MAAIFAAVKRIMDRKEHSCVKEYEGGTRRVPPSCFLYGLPLINCSYCVRMYDIMSIGIIRVEVCISITYRVRST